MNGKIFRRSVMVLLSALLLAYCAAVPPAPEPRTALVRLAPASYPAFSDDLHYDGLFHAIDRSLDYLRRLPPDRRFRFGKDAYDRPHLVRSLEAFAAFVRGKPDASALNAYLRSHFLVYAARGQASGGKVLFTGYYEPLLAGSRTPDRRFRWPIYKRPDDLITANLGDFSQKFEGERIVGRVSAGRLEPYFDRSAIDGSGALEGRAEVLAWVDDPVDLFFLHIQGSGKIFLPSGSTLNVHYDVTNGKPYRSIGKLLIEEGKIPREEMSMQAIRAYLERHPEQRERILYANPSYVFFQQETRGPIGSLEVLLTPGRSLATDRRLFPPAALAFVQTSKPLADGKGGIRSWTPMARFVLNQDTGGAIQGPGRADLFWGNGPYARLAAGHMQHQGRLVFLVLKPGDPK
ncbi:MAG: murein transglycosylase A [Desulfobacteraceae bacterium]|nr:murein transglycosylase A [Desulfobacteraceae bacterium]